MSGEANPPTPARRTTPPRPVLQRPPVADAEETEPVAPATRPPIKQAASTPARPPPQSAPPPKPASAPQPVAPVAPAPTEIIARPAVYYRATRYIMVVLLVGMGMWFCYDGWRGYPKENAVAQSLDEQLAAKQKEIASAKAVNDIAAIADKQEEYTKLNLERTSHKPHQRTDIILQKVLGIALPVLGILTLMWSLRASRGVYRLEQQTLHVPGHPAIPLGSVLTIDRTLWDRKGIAYIEYETDGARGRIKLDDYIYERDPTDAIFKQIEEYLAPTQL